MLQSEPEVSSLPSSFLFTGELELLTGELPPSKTRSSLHSRFSYCDIITAEEKGEIF
jgi:hypothetical protein